MSATTRTIIVDDNDSRIKYSPSWLLDDTGIKDTVGTFGPTLNSTLHKTESNGTLQFKFTGTQIALFGTTEDTQGTQSGNVDPTWTCFVDDTKINSTTPSKFARNNQNFCDVQDLADEPHILMVNVTIGSEGHPFWVDYISYTPSRSVPLDNSLIRVSNVDPNIRYDFRWRPLGDVCKYCNMTRTRGSLMSFDFIGQSLSWYGVIPTGTGFSTNVPSFASYAVDDRPSVPFTLKSGTPGLPLYDQLFFETSTLPLGPHSIRVTFIEGNWSSIPLTLAFMLVKNGTSVDSAFSPTSTPTSTPSSSTVKPTTHDNVNIGGVVGGSLAAIFILLLITFLFLFIRYRKQMWKTKTLIPRPFFPKSVVIETDKANTVFTQNHASHGLEPVDHNIRSQTSNRSTNANFDEIDENSSYYGGYRTWGQIKAMEVASRSNKRDSYM